MNEKIKEYLEKAKTAIGKVSKKVWIIAVAVLVLIAVGLVIFFNTRPYSVLITGASNDEISAVLSWMDTQGYTDYRLENGDTILVPSSQENRLKARLLMEGYPNKAFSYPTYFDNVSALSTESERNRAYIMALEEKIAAVLECLDGVRDAVVDITPGETTGFVSDSGTVHATASVIVTLGEGQMLSNDMAAAIRNYVANSVQGLSVDRISIIDNWGNTYNSIGANDVADADASMLKIQLEEQWSNIIRTRIMQVLTPLYGEKNVKATVHVQVEVSNSIIDDHDVHLPAFAEDGSTEGRGIIGSLVYDHSVVRGGETAQGGTVGTEANSDWPQYVEDIGEPNGNEQQIGVSGQIDYNNGTTDTHTERTAGYISDCTVAVSINSTTAGPVDLDEVRNHVARAAGINAYDTEEMTAAEYLRGKVSILSQPFYEDTTPGEPTPGGWLENLPVPSWVVLAAGIGLLLFVILLVVLLILRGKKKKKQEAEALAAAEAAAAAEQQNAVAELLEAAGIAGTEPAGADVMELQTERSMELRHDIRQFVDENPEIAAQLVKSWLKGEDDNG